MKRKSGSIWSWPVLAALALFAPLSAGLAQDSPLPVRADGSSVFADVAERVGPAVVFIRTERAPTQDRGDRPDSPFEFFREFFPEPERRDRFHGDGGGSGFVFDDEGRILTNYHVIRDAERITVIMGNGDKKELEAEVVGYDPHTDIAIIQVDPPNNLVKVALGDSDKMRVGDWVMAIGTPFGQLQGTVTVGIVSAKGRSDLNIVGGTPTYQDYIQTDASINFGNSGGPLVNLKGQAIGINTAINPSGQGIGFAIPINMARNIMEQLIAKGRVRYGFIGIRLQEMDQTLAQARGVDIDHGILVDYVYPGSPAADGGLKTGDVIIRYDGQDVRDDRAFRLMVGNTEVGKEVPVVVVRGGKEVAVDIEIGERPEGDIVASTEEPRGDAWLGLRVDDVANGEYRRRYGVEKDQEGVVVLEVDEGSPAGEAGIREGDVITEVYSHEVGDLEDYVAISKKLKDRKEPIAFLVVRGRTSTYVPVMPDKR
jgi:Do/DeqQ family serine protease